MRGTLRPPAILALLAALLVAVAVGACGGEADEHDVVEGEPARVGELDYNVQVSRFLNPEDVADAEVLAGEPRPPFGENYLGVFMTIVNDTDRDLRSASDYSIVDIRGNTYEPIEPESPFVLQVGARVPAGGQLPQPDSPAAGASGGALIFLVEDVVIDSRPLRLEIATDEETASVQLDM